MSQTQPSQPQSQPPHTNRLARESSPYLLQHAHNPVDWYPWGPEAFEAARAQDKPIFLSVGYSTCYWCHVMERQSFENEAVAKEMNDRFINIKVDREERPDVDQLYMTAVQVLTRHGGWPMSVWLTPDLRPFYGGTYFPPQDHANRPGFVTILRSLDDFYKNKKVEVEKAASQLTDILRQLAEPQAPDRPMEVTDDWIEELIERSVSDYDATHGGFGTAPKFPRQTLIELLLTYCSTLAGNPEIDQVGDEGDRKLRILGMVRHTLDALANGGIRDQLGGGFHRYSTDAKWLVPHFEIMLYDNAMLAWCYVELYRQTENLRYAEVARGILDFVLSDLTSPQGAFYTALDAEVDGQEGLNYLWTREQIEQILGPDDAKLFNRVYGVDQGPNFADPHHGTGTADKNVLYLAHPAEADDQRERLEPMRRKLLEARRQRKQPLLDTKIITSWNALMIRALSYAGELLQDQRYLDAAARAADYLLRQHRHQDGSLIRTSGGGGSGARGGAGPAPAQVRAPGEEVYVSTPTSDTTAARFVEPPQSEPRERQATTVRSTEPPRPSEPIPAFLDDYAFLIDALLALRQASGRDAWREHAASLAMLMISRFGDDARGGFFYSSSEATDLIVRQKVGSDSPLPSGNAVAARVMQDLRQPDTTRNTLAVFARQMHEQGEAMSAMVEAALHYIRQHGEFAVAPLGPGEAPATGGGADRPASPAQVAGEVVSMRPEWTDDGRTLVVRLNILDAFHINAHEASEGLVATVLNVTGDGGDVEATDYPPGERRGFAFSDRPINVYQGEVSIAVRFRTPPTRPVRVAVTYQACEETACLPAVTKQVEVRPQR